MQMLTIWRIGIEIQDSNSTKWCIYHDVISTDAEDAKRTAQEYVNYRRARNEVYNQGGTICTYVGLWHGNGEPREQPPLLFSDDALGKKEVTVEPGKRAPVLKSMWVEEQGELGREV